MPHPAEMPLSRASRIEHFVIQYIYNQEFDGKDGATIKTLVDVLREEFCNEATWRDEDSPRKEKMEMKNVIRMMASKQLLATIDGTDPIAFTIHPSVQVRKYLLKPVSRQASRQASVEFEQEEVAKELLLDKPIDQSEIQSPQKDNADIGNAEAYAEVRKGAATLFLPTEIIKPPEQIEIEQNEVIIPQAGTEQTFVLELPTSTFTEALSPSSEVFSQPEASGTNPETNPVAQSPNEQEYICKIPPDTIATPEPQPKHPSTEPPDEETNSVSQSRNEQECIPGLLMQRILESLEAQPKAVFQQNAYEARTCFAAQPGNGADDAPKTAAPSTMETQSPKPQKGCYQEPPQTQQDEVDTAMSEIQVSESENFNSLSVDSENRALPLCQTQPEAVLDDTSAPTSGLASGSGCSLVSHADSICLVTGNTEFTAPLSLAIPQPELIATASPKSPWLDSGLEGKAQDEVQDCERDVTPATPCKDLHETEGTAMAEHQSLIEDLHRIEPDIGMTEGTALIEEPVSSREPVLIEEYASAEGPFSTGDPAQIEDPASSATPASSENPVLSTNHVHSETQASIERAMSIDDSSSAEDSAAIENQLYSEKMASIEESMATQETAPMEGHISCDTLASIDKPMSLEGQTLAENLAPMEDHISAKTSTSIVGPMSIEGFMSTENSVPPGKPALTEEPTSTEDSRPMKDAMDTEGAELNENSGASESENLGQNDDPMSIAVPEPVKDATLFKFSEPTRDLVLPKHKPGNICEEYFEDPKTDFPAEPSVSFAPISEDIPRSKSSDTIIVDVGKLEAQGLAHSLRDIQKLTKPHLERTAPRLEPKVAHQEKQAVLPATVHDVFQKKQDDFQQEFLSRFVAQVPKKESLEIMPKPREAEGLLPLIQQQTRSKVSPEISQHARLSPPLSYIAQSSTPPRQQPRKPRSPPGQAGFVSQGPPRSHSETNASRIEHLRPSGPPLGSLDPNSLSRKRRAEDACPKSQEDDRISASKTSHDNVRDSLSMKQGLLREEFTGSVEFDGSVELHEESQREDIAEPSSKVQHIQSNPIPEFQMQDQANASAGLARAGSPEPEFDSRRIDFRSFAQTEDDSRMDLDDAPDSSQPIRTPRRKRQRVMEISASDSESSFDPISPVRHLNSMPRRPYERLCTPNSESRRQSAPSRIFSSMKVASPRIPKRLSDTDPAGLSLKREKKPDNSPAWLKQAAEALRGKFPDDLFETEDGQVRCLDCDRPFKPANNGSLSGLQAHLNGRPHKAEREKRSEKALLIESQVPASTLGHVSKDLDFDYSLPQEPLAVYMHQNHQNTLASMRQYHADMEASFRLRSIQGHHLEHGFRTFEKRAKDQIDQIEATVAASDRAHLEKHRNMLERVDAFEEHTNEQLAAMAERLDKTDARMDDATRRFEAVKSHMNEVEKKTSDDIDEMFSKLARSDHRNIGQIEDIKEAQKIMELRAKDWEQNSGKIETLAEDQLKLDLKAKEREQRSRRKFQDATAQINSLERTVKIQNETIQRLESLVNSQIQLQSEQAEKQTETIQRLESMIQSEVRLRSEQGQRQRESEQAFKNATGDQMEAQSKQFEKQIATMERDFTTRFGLLKEQLSKRIEAIEEKHMLRIRSLEKSKAHQKEIVERHETFIPALLGDLRELKEYCQDEFEKLDKKVNESTQRVDGASPAKVQRRRGPSPIL